MRSSTRTCSPFRLLTAALLIQSAGCADSNVGPPDLSSLSIGVILSGVDTNESFLISLDGRDPQRLYTVYGLVLRSVASGRHSVTLSGFRERRRP